MLTINQSQLAAMTHSAGQTFAKDIAKRFRRCFGEQVQQLDADDIGQQINAGIARAEGKQLGERRAMCKYLTLHLLYGDNNTAEHRQPGQMARLQPAELKAETVHQVYDSVIADLKPDPGNARQVRALEQMAAETNFKSGGAYNKVIQRCPYEEGEEENPANNHFIALEYLYQDNDPVQNAPYTLALSDGSTLKGQLDLQGRAQIEYMPVGPFEVNFAEDTRAYCPASSNRFNPLHGKIPVAVAIQIAETGHSGLFQQAANIAADGGDWFWGVLQGDFNHNPSTAQIVLGTLISMIPLVDQVMDLRDISANIMLLVDENIDNDTLAWIALVLTTIGLVPLFGSALKGAFKVLLKNSADALETALAVLRQLGKGDPYKFLKNLNWQQLGRDVMDIARRHLGTIKAVLNGILNSWLIRSTLNSQAMQNISRVINRLGELERTLNDKLADALYSIKNTVGSIIDRGSKGNIKNGNADIPQIMRTVEIDGQLIEHSYIPHAGVKPVGGSTQIFAVKDSWNDDGYMIEYKVTKEIKTWKGRSAGQRYKPHEGLEFYLAGGEEQLFIAPGAIPKEQLIIRPTLWKDTKQ